VWPYELPVCIGGLTNDDPREHGCTVHQPRRDVAGDTMMPDQIGPAVAVDVTDGADLPVPHPRGSAQHGRSVESRDDREGLEVKVVVMRRGERWMQRAEVLLVLAVALLLLVGYLISRFSGS
jgi:hypothetical protein